MSILVDFIISALTVNEFNRNHSTINIKTNKNDTGLIYVFTSFLQPFGSTLTRKDYSLDLNRCVQSERYLYSTTPMFE